MVSRTENPGKDSLYRLIPAFSLKRRLEDFIDV